MKKKMITIILGILAVVAIAGFVVIRVRNLRQPVATKTPKPAATATPIPVPDPLTIEAVKAKVYAPSPLEVTANLGNQGSYSETVVSYLSDGFKVYAQMSTPTGAAPAGGWPVIILNHGYIDPTTYSTTGPEYRQFISTFTAAGYMVVKPDYRGHGQSQGTAVGAYFSPDYTYDLLYLIASLKAAGQINSARIGLLGHSMGGAVIQRAIVVSSDIKASVFMAGVVGSMDDIFYNWPHTRIYTDKPYGLQTKDRQVLVQKYGDPKADPAFWHSVAPISYVANITGPVQVNQDVADDRVPTLFADHFVAALKEAGKSVEYHQYPGNDHQFANSRAELLQNMLVFYGANL